MFGIGAATRIYLAPGATDMRKGFDGLYGLVRKTLAGLNIATRRSDEHSDEHAVFLSGNGYLLRDWSTRLSVLHEIFRLVVSRR